MTSDEPEPVPLHSLAIDHQALESATRAAAMRADFLDFYDQEYHLVVRFMIRWGAALPEAEDATQEAFLAAWQCMVQQTHQWDKIRNRALWIRIVARNKHRRPLGDRRPHTVTMAEVLTPRTMAEDHVGMTATTLDVLTALRQLDEEARTVMALRLDGFTSAELAQHLGITQQKVRDALKRARRELADELGTVSRPRRRPKR